MTTLEKEILTTMEAPEIATTEISIITDHKTQNTNCVSNNPNKWKGDTIELEVILVIKPENYIISCQWAHCLKN